LGEVVQGGVFSFTSLSFSKQPARASQQDNEQHEN
jgi:hypothetical protein